MIEFTLRHTIDCTPARYWELFFDADWTHDLFDDGLNFRCEVGPTEVDAGIRRRTMQVVPKVELPGPVAKLFGDKLGYVEHGRYDEAKQLWHYELRLNILADKIRLGGDMTLEPLSEDRLTRVSVMWVEAKIFGIGGLVEKAAEKNMHDGWDKSADWINRWLAQHPADT